MPKVGGKKFPYTKEGEKAAEAYAGKTGDSVDKYYAGGSVTDARQRGQTYQMGGVVDPFSSRNPQNVGLSPEGDPTMPSSPIPPPENQLGDNPVVGAAAPAPGAVEEGEAPPAIPGAPAMSGGSPPNVMGEADAPQMKFGGLVTTDARDRKKKFKEGGQVDVTDVVKEVDKPRTLFDPADEEYAGIMDHGWPFGMPKKWGDVPKSLNRVNEQLKRKGKSVNKIAEKALKSKTKKKGKKK